MAAGMTNLRFKIETKPVTATQTVTITVRHGSPGSRSVNLTVTPPGEPLALDSIQVSTGTFGGNEAGGQVNLTAGHVDKRLKKVNRFIRATVLFKLSP
ncbi:MAG TPA: hypothetical protein VF604_11925 [Pyrinomonadaceae bacterium]|jgi:hypothetical protein